MAEKLREGLAHAHRQREVAELGERGGAGFVDEDAAGVSLEGGAQGDDGDLLGADGEDGRGVGDAEGDAASGDLGDDGGVGSTVDDLEVEAGRGVVAGDLGGEQAAVLWLGEPVEGELHAAAIDLSFGAGESGEREAHERVAGAREEGTAAQHVARV